MSHVRKGARAKRIRQAAAEKRLADVIVDVTPEQVVQIKAQVEELLYAVIQAEDAK